MPDGTVTVTNGTLKAAREHSRRNIVDRRRGALAAGTGTVIVEDPNQTLPPSSFNNLRIEAKNETSLVAYWKLDEGNGGHDLRHVRQPEQRNLERGSDLDGRRPASGWMTPPG